MLGFYGRQDIPGENVVFSPEVLIIVQIEELFPDKRVAYHGQPVGVIAAKNFNLAQRAAKLVKITYERSKSTKPVLADIKAVLEHMGDNRIHPGAEKDGKVKVGAKNDDTFELKGQHEVRGEFNTPGQYHYTMETQTTVCVPRDGKYDVYCASQWIGTVHYAVTKVLGVPSNLVNVTVGRLGGGYGAKISGGVRVAATAALVCYHLKRPTRFVLQLEQNMGSVGSPGQ